VKEGTTLESVAGGIMPPSSSSSPHELYTVMVRAITANKPKFLIRLVKRFFVRFILSEGKVLRF
jgi:hypothetical protein